MKYYKLVDVCKVKGGKRIPQGETLQDEPNDHPYIKIVDMYQGKVIEIDNKIQYARNTYQPKIENYIVHKGDVILAIVGNTLGLVSIIGNSLDGANLTENCCKFVNIDESKVLHEFLYYSLVSPLNQRVIQKFKVGSSQPKLPIYNIERLLIPQISIKEQQKLCASLSSIDTQIKRNNAMVQKLQVLAQAIYTHWFLQFEFPNDEGKPYKSSGGKMVLNDKINREVPEGWQTKSLKDCCKIVLGGTPKTDETKYWNGDINWLNSGEIANFPIINSELKITTLGMNNSATTLMKKGTTVVSITGNLRASILAIDSCANQSVVGILENSEFKSSYIYPFIKNMIVTFSKISTGNCQQHINKGTIENAVLLIPNEKVLKDYYEKVNKINLFMFKNSVENQKLISLRNTLLPLLINGQLQ